MKKIILIALCILFVSSICAQDDDVWKKLYDKDGFNVSFIFYGKADCSNNGIVVKIKNSGGERVFYSFKLIMRAEDKEADSNLAGWMDDGEVLTGSDNGLLFIPFKDGTSIKEVGIKNVKVVTDDD